MNWYFGDIENQESTHDARSGLITSGCFCWSWMGIYENCYDDRLFTYIENQESTHMVQKLVW